MAPASLDGRSHGPGLPWPTHPVNQDWKVPGRMPSECRRSDAHGPKCYKMSRHDSRDSHFLSSCSLAFSFLSFLFILPCPFSSSSFFSPTSHQIHHGDVLTSTSTSTPTHTSSHQLTPTPISIIQLDVVTQSVKTVWLPCHVLYPISCWVFQMSSWLPLWLASAWTLMLIADDDDDESSAISIRPSLLLLAACFLGCSLLTLHSHFIRPSLSDSSGSARQ